jgi:hypothetical protein
MSKWEENKWVVEELEDIKKTKQEMQEEAELFNKYSGQIMEMDPKLFDWLKSGFQDSQYWDQQSIDNAKDWLSDSKRAYENRVAGAKKAAETRKLNKLKAAS